MAALNIELTSRVRTQRSYWVCGPAGSFSSAGTFAEIHTISGPFHRVRMALKVNTSFTLRKPAGRRPGVSCEHGKLGDVNRAKGKLDFAPTCRYHPSRALVAQLVEQLICNQ
jgi:hypothetical protein